MPRYTTFEEIQARRPPIPPDVRAAIERDFALAQIIYDLRIEAGLTQKALAQRMGTTQSVISRLEEGGGIGNRVDTLARIAKALGRHLVISFPVEVPAELPDGVQVA